MKYKLVYIEWMDSTSWAGWRTNSEVDEWNNVAEDWGYCKQVGWLIRESKTSIVVAGRLIPKTKFNEEQWGDLQKIPKTWIKKRKILKI